MTCRGYNHVGTLFAFPSAWANAPDPVNPYVMWIDIENGFWCVPYIGATLAKKQMLLSALEAGLFLAKVRTAPHSATFNSNTQLSGVPAMLATGTARSVLLDHRKIFDAGLLTTCPSALLEAMRTAVEKDTVYDGRFTYFPPGTGNLGYFSTVFDCDFCAASTNFMHSGFATFAQQMQAIDGQLAVYETGVNADSKYVGMEDARLYPIFSDADEMNENGFPNLLLWEDVSSFLGSDFPIATRVRWHHNGVINRGMWSLVSAIRQSSDHSGGPPADIIDPTFPPALPPGASGTHPRRLSSFLFACYAHVLDAFRSQEVASRRCLKFPHHTATVRAYVDLTIEYQPSCPDPSDPDGFSATASVSVTDRGLTVDEDTEDMLYDHLSFRFNQNPTPVPAEWYLPTPEAARHSWYVAKAMTLEQLEAAGVGSVVTDPSTGAQWIEFTTEDYIAAATLDADAIAAFVPEWWTDDTGSAPDEHTVRLSYSLDYTTPYIGDGENLPAIEADIDEDYLPCAAAAWIMDETLMCSAIGRGQAVVRASAPAASRGVTGVMASATGGEEGDDFQTAAASAGAALVRKAIAGAEAFYDSVSDNLNGVFGHGEAVDITLLSDAAIEAQIQAEVSQSVGASDVNYRYRLPIYGCSFSGLQAKKYQTDVNWGAPETMTTYGPRYGDILLARSDFHSSVDASSSSPKLNWLRLPQWLRNFNTGDGTAAVPGNPDIAVEMDVMTVGALAMKMHGTN